MSTKSPPRKIGAAEVVAFAVMDSNSHRTNMSRQLVGGRPLGSASGLAIGTYSGEPGFYLFFCDAGWNPFNNTWHDTIEAAKRAAEFEYEGIAASWRSPA